MVSEPTRSGGLEGASRDQRGRDQRGRWPLRRVDCYGSKPLQGGEGSPIPKDFCTSGVTASYLCRSKTKNNYVTFQDVNGHRTRFHEKKTTWGFDKLISLDYFADIEILALPEFTRLDWCLSMTKPPETMNTFTWTINRFSDVTDECVSSEVFKLVKVKWYMKLWVYPKGNNSGEGTHLSIYLGVDDVALFPDGWKLYQNSNSGLKVNLPKGIERKKLKNGCATQIKFGVFHLLCS
ncbi:hypothetical protein R6Q59_000264 [Mikania micrantha]